MENYKLIHTIIKTAVENGIRYIEDNPKLGLRNLLDLGEYFASGRFQKYFFNLAHEILNNEDSCYYDIIENLVKNTNHRNLTVCGINIGYNSFTHGANIIREHEKKFGFNIPWSIVFNFEGRSEDSLTGSEVSNIINSGRNIGIYSYMIFLGKNNISDSLYSIFEKNDDCAFIIFIDPCVINEETAEKISSIPNICIFALIDDYNESSGSVAEKFDFLRKYKCLHGGYYCYDDSNAGNIANGTITGTLLSLNLNFVIYVKRPGCSDVIAKNVYDYIYKTRTKINSPVFPMDFYGDIEYIDKIISDEPCFLSIGSCGQIGVPNISDETGHNIRSASLEDILATTMPEVKYL
ncbi:hypothetical protein [Sedimentibacter sp.]|uniref:hypothetical protein n=1 Tax=Sedimentibacter sp. TaxID=1960295 RepID=UPI0028ABF28B|nr:hypothetical protein [Sedimentibacter sp.]